MKYKIGLFIVISIIIPWSIITILLSQIKGILLQQANKPTIIEVDDTIINEQPKFFSQSPKESLEESLSYYNLEHKDVFYA